MNKREREMAAFAAGMKQVDKQLGRVDEDYVREILALLPAGLSVGEFRSRCQIDVNAGYAREVAAAERRYFVGGDDAAS